MIYYPLTAATVSNSLPKAVGATFSADGQALIRTIVSGHAGIAPAAGAAGEVFAGFLHAKTSAQPFLQTTLTLTEEVTLSAGGVVVLRKVPLAGTVGAFSITDNAPIISANFTVGSDGTFTAAGSPSDQVRITYVTALTVDAARAVFGDVQPGGYVGDTIGYASVMEQGTIYTDQYDTTVDWSAATAVKLAAGGKVTNQAGAGVTINAVVYQIPTASIPFLGLRVNAI